MNEPLWVRMLMDDKWLRERTFDHQDFADLNVLAEQKNAAGLTVSVCLPTLNVGATLGPILETIGVLKEAWRLIDQVAVVDSRSEDDSRAIAAAGGAEVYLEDDVLPDIPPAGGKGEALWKSLAVLTGDIIIWIDSDIIDFHPRFIYGLLGPLLVNPEISYVKAFYRRPLFGADGTRQENEGGRVTELCARPLINMFWPELSNFIQPLSGESAARRELLESVPFFTDYAVELGLLVGILRQRGLWTMAQVDLAERVHGNQSLYSLGRMSFAIMQAALKLLHEDGVGLDAVALTVREAFTSIDGKYIATQEKVRVVERPPFASLGLAEERRFPEKV